MSTSAAHREAHKASGIMQSNKALLLGHLAWRRDHDFYVLRAPVTAAELAKCFAAKMDVVEVRRRLNDLLKDGLVEKCAPRRCSLNPDKPAVATWRAK